MSSMFKHLLITASTLALGTFTQTAYAQATFSVANGANTGSSTLNAAITAGNLQPSGPNTFNVSVATINITSALPTILNSAIFNYTSASNGTWNDINSTGVSLSGVDLDFRIANAAATYTLNTSIDDAASGGSVTFSGPGTFVVGASSFIGASGGVNFNNGIVAAGTANLGIDNGGATALVNFNGGRLRLTGATENISSVVAIDTGNGTIDLNGADLTVDNTIDGPGGLTIAGSGTLTASMDVGASTPLAFVNAGANGQTATFNGALTTDTLQISGTGVVNALDINAGGLNNIRFDGNGTVNVGADNNIAGTVVASSANIGTLNLLGGSQTVTGAVGSAANPLLLVTAGADGATSVFSSTVNARNINIAGAGDVTFSGATAGAVHFLGNGSATLDVGIGLTGSVDTASNNIGTLTLAGGTQSVSGAVGTTTNRLLAVNAGADGAVSTFAGTVNATTINITGAGQANFNGAVNGNIDFNGNGIALLGSGTSLTGNVVVDNTGTGTLTLAGGAQSVSGTVGSSTNLLNALNVGANGGTATFNGAVNANNVNITGTGAAIFNQTLTATTLNFAGNGSATLGSGQNFTGAVTTATNGTGTLNLAGGAQTVSSAIGTAGNALLAVNAGANGATSNFSNAVFTQSLNVTGTGTVNLNQGLIGALNFAGNGVTNVAAGWNISGAVTSAAANSGTLNLLGGTQSVGGSIGANNPLLALNIAATGGTTSFGGSVAARDININGTSAVNFGGAVSGAVHYGTNNTGITLANGMNLNGSIDVGSANIGTLTLAGGAQTVSGSVGAANALLAVNAGADGATSIFGSTVNAQDINVTGSGTTNFNGTVTGAVHLLNGGTAVLGSGAGLTGTVDTATNGTGTFTLAGGTQSVSGTVGAAGLSLLALNAGANGATSNFGGTVWAQTTNITGTGTANFAGNVIGALTFVGNGTANIAAGNRVTGAITTAANNSGTLNLQGGTQMVGAVGAAGAALLAVNAGATGATTNFNAAVFAQSLNVTGTGTANLNQGLNGALNYGGNGIANVAVGQNISGAVTTATNNTGTLNLLGGAQSVGGAVGTTSNALLAVNAGADGATSSFNGAVFAQNLNFTGNGVVALNSNLTGAVTTAGNGTGTLTLAGGTQTVSGTVGSASNALLAVNSGANGGAATFSGPVFAQSVNLTGTGSTSFQQSITGNLHYAANSSATLASGANLTGAVVIDSNGLGTLTLAGGNQSVSGAIGAPGISLVALNAGATGAVSNFGSTVWAQTTNITGTGTANFAGNVIGALNFASNGVANVASGGRISGAVTTAANNTGTLNLQGGAQMVGGAIGSSTNALLAVNLAGATTTFGGNVFAQNVNLTAPGTINLNAGNNLTGALTTAANNAGVLNLLGGTQTVSGPVGSATNALQAVNAGANGAASSFSGLVNAQTAIITGTGTANFNGGLTGALNFATNGTASVTGASTISGVTAATASTGTLSFAGGTQTVNGTVGSLLTLNAGANGATTNFNGVVNAVTTNITGSGTVNFANTVNGDLDFAGDGTANFAAGQSVAGTINVGQGGQGALNFAGSSSISAINSVPLRALTLGGTGSTLNVTGNLVAANTTSIGGNTLSTTGSFTLGAGQRLNLDVTGATSNGQVVAGAPVTIANGALVNLNVTTLAPIVGNNFTLISAPSGGSVGTLTPTNITDNSVIVNFVQVANPDSLVVQAVLAYIPQTPNTANAFSVFSSPAVVGSTDPTLLQIQNTLVRVPSNAAAEQLVQSLTPTVDRSTITTVVDAGETIQRLTDGRLYALRNDNGGTTQTALLQPRNILSDAVTGDASGSAPATNGSANLWLQGYGQTAVQDPRQGVNGYQSTTYGGALGFDTARIFEGTTLGLALSFTRSDIDSRNANATKANINSYGIEIYGATELPFDVHLTGQFNYAYNDIGSTRHNVGGIGLNAQADYHSDQYGGKVSVARDYQYDGLRLTPALFLNYTRVDTDSYTETGAGGASLRVVNSGLNVLDLGIGVDAGWKLKPFSDGSLLEPTLHATYAYDATGDRVQTTANFTGAGAAFVANGFSVARSRGNVGGGLTYTASQRLQFRAGYDYEFKSDFSAHSGYLRAQYSF